LHGIMKGKPPGVGEHRGSQESPFFPLEGPEGNPRISLGKTFAEEGKPAKGEKEPRRPGAIGSFFPYHPPNLR
jgi:hypothetical protein